jgi:hypothetical protein
MNKRFKLAAGLTAGLLAASPACFAQYTATLTGVGTGTVADGVYVSPYVGTIQGPGVDYTGFMVCDDFTTESHLNMPWSATTTNAGALNGSEKFASNVVFGGQSYSAQYAYDAAAWLANHLVQTLTPLNKTAQIDYSFAIWDLFDGQPTDPNGLGNVATYEQEALSAALGGYTGSNVSVYTPSLTNPKGLRESQEFLVVNPVPAPEMDASSAGGAVTLLLGSLLILRGRRVDRSR